MGVIHTPHKPQPDGRLLFFPIACGCFLSLLFLRLWYFQVVLSPTLTEHATVAGHHSVPVLAPRGLIFDRDNNLLAGVRPSLVVTVIPGEADRHPEVLRELAKILNVDVAQLAKKLKKGMSRQLPVPVFEGATVEEGAKIDEEALNLPGVGVDIQPMRYYANTTDFTHILGRVWVPDPNDVKRFSSFNSAPPPYVGKEGIEWFYETMLMGQQGSEDIQTNRKHQPVRILGGDSPVPGSQLYLGVEAKLQKIAQEELVYKHERGVPGAPRKGAVVAIDPNTGEILCMYSSPSYDLKQFEGGISKEDFDALLQNEDKPFEDRVLDGYAPGSTFKIITSVAMQEQGIFDTSSTVFCDGGFHLSKKVELKCLGHHGNISYLEAMKKSCNTYFCTMGVRLGPEAMAKAAEEMGLGEKVGLDVRSDTHAGVVPTPEYKAKHKMGKWYMGDTANTAIGQGYVSASPLQMADVAAMVANRGVMYRPHLVRAIKKPGEEQAEPVQPEVIHRLELPDSFWDTLHAALHGVIGKGGTAENCIIPGLDWAGKTGSAEFRRQEKTHSWFIGYAPLDHPKIAIAVIVEEAGHGAAVAGPIARDIVQAYLASGKS